MCGRVAVQAPKRGGQPATSGGCCLQKNLAVFEVIPLKGKGCKWVAFGILVKDGRENWMCSAKHVRMWHQEIEKGVEALDNAWLMSILVVSSHVRRS